MSLLCLHNKEDRKGRHTMKVILLQDVKSLGKKGEVVNASDAYARNVLFAKKQAVDQASAIAQNILQEANVENLLEAKGIRESVVYIANGECNVVVDRELTDTDTLIVQEVVMEQTNLSADKIKIIGKE